MLNRLFSPLLSVIFVVGLVLPGSALTPPTPGDAGVAAAPQLPVALSGAELSLPRAQAFGQLPLYFVANAGQTDAHVDFYVQGRDKTLYFSPEGVTLALTAPRAGPARDDVTAPLGPKARTRAAPAIQRWTVKLDFVGASARVHAVGQDRASATFSYLKGRPDEWHAGLAAYTQIVYPDLWPGIDLVVRGDANQLKFEYQVRPGADPRQVRLAYRGASAVRETAEGELEVSTPLGSFRDARPVAYQDVGGRRMPVEVRYRLDGARADQVVGQAGPGWGEGRAYSFELGNYDASRPLVLDPAILVYAGYIGGAGDDIANGIAVDSAGSAYVTGYTDSDEATFPKTVGPNLIYNNNRDAFVAKVKADGTGLVYAGYIGGAGSDEGRGIAVDSAGNAYVVGATDSISTTFPVTVGPFLSNSGGSDAFVAKVKADGTGLAYAGYIGGSSDDAGNGIAVDSAGNAYVVGTTDSISTTFPVTVGPFLSNNGGTDAFVAKVKADGKGLVYAGYIGGSGSDVALGIAVDSAGNAYVAGYTTSTAATFPVRVGPDLNDSGNADTFVAKVKADGTELVYAGYIGGSNYDFGNGITVDSAGNAYVVGTTDSISTTFPVTVGPFLSNGGGYDAFVAKVKADGTELVYAGYIGGTGSDVAQGIAVDSAGNAYVGGWTVSGEGTFPVTGGPDLVYNGGGNDAFVAKVNAAGTALNYAGYIGSSASDVALGIALDNAGNAYVAGRTGLIETGAPPFPATVGPDLEYNGGDNDAFVAKVSADEYKLFLPAIRR